MMSSTLPATAAGTESVKVFDYFKYLLSPLILSAHAYGLWIGGNYAWLGLAMLLGVLALDGGRAPPVRRCRDGGHDVTQQRTG